MRIGFSTLMIQRGKTGIAQHVLALLKAFASGAPNHQFFVFALEEDLPLLSRFSQAMEIVPVAEAHRPALRNISWHHLHLPRLVKRLKLDVLHIPSYRRLIARRVCPLVATIHDLAPFRVPEKYDVWRMFYGRVIVKKLAARQDKIIAVSENTARDIQQFFKIPRHKLTVINNGIDHDRFSPGDVTQARLAVRQQHSLDQPYLLYVSRLEHPGKNHVRLIAAFERFKSQFDSPLHLVFAGSNWHGAGKIHQAISQSHWAAAIHSLGFVSDDQLPDLYRAADALVYPSLFEGFGMPVVEAMACGCPVISSTRGSLEEVAGNGAALIVNPENIDDMSDKFAEFTRKPELRKSLVQAGFDRARKFDWERAAQQTLEVYAEATGQRESFACLH